jgi:hypothetical protein
LSFNRKKKAKPDPAKVEAAGKEAKEREKEGKPGKTAAELKFEEMQRKRVGSLFFCRPFVPGLILLFSDIRT